MSPDTKANLVAAIAALFFVVALVGATSSLETDDVQISGTTDSAPARPGTSNAAIEEPGDRIMGAEDAPVTIIEYASLTCGACGQFHATVFKQIKEKYIDTGKVRLIFREFPTRPVNRAVAGFILARCVPEDRYFGFLDVLFRQQARWVPAPNAKDELKNIAKLSGMSEEKFESCINNSAEIERIGRVADNGERKYGIDSTPSFVINGKKYTNMSFQQFEAILDPLIGG